LPLSYLARILQETGELSEHVRGPEGVPSHPNGYIYIAGVWSHNVVAYDNGKIVSEVGGLSAPHDLELNPVSPDRTSAY
jgi:hypothetical protein